MLSAIKRILTLRCEEAAHIRLRHEHGESTRVERIAERLHRGICSACRQARHAELQMRRAIDSVAPTDQPEARPPL